MSGDVRQWFLPSLGRNVYYSGTVKLHKTLLLPHISASLIYDLSSSPCGCSDVLFCFLSPFSFFWAVLIAVRLVALCSLYFSTMASRDPLVHVERFIQKGLARLPKVVSRWLGYRGKLLPPSVTWVVCLWGFIGAFVGLSVVLAVFGHTEYFRSRAVPPIIASFVSGSVRLVILVFT